MKGWVVFKNTKLMMDNKLVDTRPTAFKVVHCCGSIPSHCVARRDCCGTCCADHSANSGSSNATSDAVVNPAISAL